MRSLQLTVTIDSGRDNKEIGQIGRHVESRPIPAMADI
jgi:hypothetical protein